MTILINPKYEHLRDWITSLPSTFYTQGRVIYNARNQVRLIPAPNNIEVCVKRFRAPRLLNRWIYSFLRPPKAVRAYANAIHLRDLGIRTPEPIAYILITRYGTLRESYIINCRSTLTHNMYEFRHHPLEGYEPIVKAFAQFTAQMHELNILHKDYSPGNILFDIKEDGNILFDLVDINRIRFNHPISLSTGCREFCRLWGKEDFFSLLAREYAHARNMEEDKCIRTTLKYWKRFWKHRK